MQLAMAATTRKITGTDTQSLRDELQEFVLENVEMFGEERVLGTGSYGSVQEVMINGEVYAAKMIHEVLLETDEHGGVESMATKYLRECRLMSRMRHPNITQFVGVCFLAKSRLPLLVMERLDCSLDELVETTHTLPLSVSVYMLMGVCRGLLHLHRESVVHRDLTARNVLLTTSLRAKITDFGNSRIVQLEPSQLARTLTKLPGTLVYMPPEAISDCGGYGSSLDIFSFGVLMLFELTQVFPGNLLPPTYSDPNNPDHILGRSELERRSVYISRLEKRLDLVGGREHRLFGMVRECLANNPERRPTTSDLLSSLEEVGTETEGGLLQLDIARVRTVRSLRAKERRIQELQREVAMQSNLLAEKDAQLARQQEVVTTKDDIIAKNVKELQERDIELAKRREQISQLLNQKDDLIAEKRAAMNEKEKALAEREALIKVYRERIEFKDAELERRTALIQQLEVKSSALVRGAAAVQEDPSQKLRPPLSLKWRRGKDMPIKMGSTVQTVVIGYSVYIGGGNADLNKDRCTVMKLDLQRNEWAKLPQYSTRGFAMTSHSNQLVLVGGINQLTRKFSDQIAVFETGKWTHPYPLMNTARGYSTAISFNNFIIVVGGSSHQNSRCDSVEVLDVRSGRWYLAEPLPRPRTELRSTRIGNTLYIMGGLIQPGSDTMVHEVDINELVAKAVSKQATPTTLWQTIKDIPLKDSTPLCVGGSLLAVGGDENSVSKPNSSIYLYKPDTMARRWVKVGDLPTARFNCSCSVLPSREVIIAGGQTGSGGWINTVSFVSIINAS